VLLQPLEALALLTFTLKELNKFLNKSYFFLPQFSCIFTENNKDEH